MTTVTVTTGPAASQAIGPQLPTRADLDAATARTEAVLADPIATSWDVHAAVTAEEAVTLGYLLRPGAAAELEAGI